MSNSIAQESDFKIVLYDKETEEALRAFSKEKIEKTQISKSHINKKENNIKLQKNNIKMICFYMSVAIVILACFISALSFHARYNEVSHLYQQLSFELETSKSENVILNTELDSKISLQNIEKYAIEKLNMQKIQKKKIYIDSKDFKNRNKNEEAFKQ